MSARFRHEDVASVPSGWKVRTVKAGSHRVRVAFPPGRRHKGSGRLVSVLHPLAGSNPCANPCSLRAANPAELMVMSANNPPRRRNAEFKAGKISQGLMKLADKADKKGHPYLAEAYREMARRNPAELLVMGANPSKRTLQREARERAERIRAARLGSGAGHNPRVEVVSSPNPPAEEIVEEFTGREVEYLDVYNEPHMPRGRYAKLGPLIALYVKPAKGGQVQRIGASEAVGHAFPDAWAGRPPLVVCDSSARQIYFVDGAQDIDASLAAFGAIDRGNGIVELGQARRIDYQCRKEHVASPDEDLWKHDHGEENGKLPTVLFDTRNKRLLYEGGDYRIEGPWIRN